MLIRDSSSSSSSFIVFCTKLRCLNSNRNPRKQLVASSIFAKKKEYSPNSTAPKKTSTANLPLKALITKNLIIQSATGVFALGFIDAGYSGDWSRIGVISKETEDLLKAAAFLVVPLCIFLIYFLSKNDDYEE